MTALPSPQLAPALDPPPHKPLRVDWRPGVAQLLSVRDDLRGVYATADYVDEAIRWSA
jgi:hypothetical protein